MTSLSRWWVGVAIAGLAATTSVPRGWYGAAAQAGVAERPAAQSVRPVSGRVTRGDDAQRAAHRSTPTPAATSRRRTWSDADARAAGPHQPRHAAGGAVAGRDVRVRGRRPHLHAEPAPRRAVLGRRAVHVGRRGVLVPGRVRREDRQPARRRVSRRRQAARRLRAGRADGRRHVPVAVRPGLRMLDALPILPKHKLEAALKAGTLRQQWGPATPPAEMAGLGPFVLQSTSAGERLVLRAQPEVLAQGRGGRAAAVPRSADASRSRPTRTPSCCACSRARPT